MIAQSRPQFAAHNLQTRLMALSVADADRALHALTAGQIDAVIDPHGDTYLLRPAQQHLRQREARLQDLVNSIPDLITVLNEAGEVEFQNSAVTPVLGYEAGELVGRSIFDFVHRDDLPGLHQAIGEIIDEVDPTPTVEFRHRTRNGIWCPLEVNFGQFVQSGARGVILTCRDITHRQIARDASNLREAASTQGSLDKDRFLAMLSHELRTPLTPALLGIHELQNDARFRDAQASLSMIRRNIELQSRLLDELMDYISIGQHKVRLLIEPIDAHEAVAFVLEICRSEIEAARLKVIPYLQATKPLVMADSMKLQQVMWNLLRNAIKFSPPSGCIFITSANESAGSFTLEIADQGIGIEPDFLPFVFEPYQQGDRSKHKSHGGLGLGMFIAKGLVESQQGTLSVTSEGAGLGAKFRLCLETAPAIAGSTSSVEGVPIVREIEKTFPPIQPAKEAHGPA